MVRNGHRQYVTAGWNTGTDAWNTVASAEVKAAAKEMSQRPISYGAAIAQLMGQPPYTPAPAAKGGGKSYAHVLHSTPPGPDKGKGKGKGWGGDAWDKGKGKGGKGGKDGWDGKGKGKGKGKDSKDLDGKGDGKGKSKGKGKTGPDGKNWIWSGWTDGWVETGGSYTPEQLEAAHAAYLAALPVAAAPAPAPKVDPADEKHLYCEYEDCGQLHHKSQMGKTHIACNGCNRLLNPAGMSPAQKQYYHHAAGERDKAGQEVYYDLPDIVEPPAAQPAAMEVDAKPAAASAAEKAQQKATAIAELTARIQHFTTGAELPFNSAAEKADYQEKKRKAEETRTKLEAAVEPDEEIAAAGPTADELYTKQRKCRAAQERNKKEIEAAEKALEEREAAEKQARERAEQAKINDTTKIKWLKVQATQLAADTRVVDQAIVDFGVPDVEAADPLFDEGAAVDGDDNGVNEVQEMRAQMQAMQQQQQAFIAESAQWQQQLTAQAEAAVAARVVEMQNVVLTERERIKAIQVKMVNAAMGEQTPETLALQEQLRASIDCQHQAAEPAPSPAPPPPPTIPEITVPTGKGSGGKRGVGATGSGTGGIHKDARFNKQESKDAAARLKGLKEAAAKDDEES